MALVRNIKSRNGSSGPIVVANYSALPDPTTVSGKFYAVTTSTGIPYISALFGGDYKAKGIYLSNGTIWVYMGEIPMQATQIEVDAGTNTDKFITPSTFENASKWNSKQDTAQRLVLASDYTLTSSTSAQKLFNVGTSNNGEFNVDASTSYEFEMFVDMTTLSATSGFFSFSLGGTATYTSLRLKTSSTKTALISGSVFDGVMTSASAYQLTIATVATVGTMTIKGFIRVNGAGTLRPTITLSQASAGVVKANSYATLTKIGTGTFTHTTNTN